MLVLSESVVDVSGIVRTLKVRGLWPVIMPRAQGAITVISHWKPLAVVLQADGADWLPLLCVLGHRGIPCVLLGSIEELRLAKAHGSKCVYLLLPVEPYEVAQGAQLVTGSLPSQGPSDIIDLGIIKIDLRAYEVEVEGKRRALPPKEFDILVQLAVQCGIPLDATELLGRVWQGSVSATVEDLHTRIWRLRRAIGDHDRPQPLIVNRRGYGYLLDVPQTLRG
ncbi:MAG: winged helix-turn-helix domain-containing protein [Streptomycetales bacterium]